MKSILVIGGLNMDVLGMPSGAFSYRDSLIGKVRLMPGGVGRNVAEQIARHGHAVELMTVMGGDAFASALESNCRDLGIGLQYAIRCEEASCVYLAVHDAQGDMAVAINDMAAMRLLDAGSVRRLPGDRFSACMLDANLSREALEAAAAHLDIPLVADPVSCEKAQRLRSILPRLTALKPNLREALELTGTDSLSDAASALLDKGVKQVYISLGKDGLYCATGDQRLQLPSIPAPMGPATGAGDAMTAGLVCAIAGHQSLEECAQSGLRFAHEHLSRMAAINSVPERNII